MPDVAVIMGLNLYRDLEKLEGSKNDAESFRDWLMLPDGGGLNAANGDEVLEVYSPAPENWDENDPRPTHYELDEALRKIMLKAITGPRPIGSRLFLFLAGHGFNDRDKLKDVALYSANHSQALPAYLAASWYAREFQRIRAFDQIALIMDCCRDTSPFQKISPPQAIFLPSDDAARKVKTFTALAAGYKQPAGEKVVNGKTVGVFSSAFMQALRTAPANLQGRLTGSIVKKYTHLYMDTQDADIDADANKEFVFIENHQAGMETARIHLINYTGSEILRFFDHENHVMREVPATTHPVEVKLPPGYYKVEVVNTRRNRLFQVPANEHIEI